MSDNKIYPTASAEAAKMMGIAGEEAHNLPVMEEPADPHSHGPEVSDHAHQTDKNDHGVEAQPAMHTKVVKTILPYMAVFAIGVFLYIFFFTSVDFTSLLKGKTSAPQSVQNTALLNLEKQNSAAYQAWIKGFYYDVSDPAVLDPNVDNSGNGLTNFQKYLLNLNPKSYDTLGLGRADSEDLTMGINPLSGLALNDSQKDIIGKYFDLETVMNKLVLNKMNGQAGTGQVAGAQVFNNASVTSTPNLIAMAEQPEANVVNANNLDINTSIPGRLQIPSLNVDAPLIYSQSTENFDKDLLNGVIHYPGTAMPGQIGTTYISGHSSNYPWVKSNFNHIFTHLGDLAVNKSFSIVVTLNNGKQATLHYVVTKSQQYSPTDQAQFANAGKSVVALSTCWPVGSTAKRLVVFGELTQVEQ